LETVEFKWRATEAGHRNAAAMAGIVNAIRSGYTTALFKTPTQALSGISQAGRVTAMSKVINQGGSGVKDTVSSLMQEFAKADPNGAASLVTDMHTVNPNHANVLLDGLLKNPGRNGAVLTGVAKTLDQLEVTASGPLMDRVVAEKPVVDGYVQAAQLGDASRSGQNEAITEHIVLNGGDATAMVKDAATQLLEASKNLDSDFSKLSSDAKTALTALSNGDVTPENITAIQNGIPLLSKEETRGELRQLAHMATAVTNPSLFLADHFNASSVGDRTTMLNNTDVAPKLSQALQSNDVPFEKRLQMAEVLVQSGGNLTPVADGLLHVLNESTSKPSEKRRQAEMSHSQATLDALGSSPTTQGDPRTLELLQEARNLRSELNRFIEDAKTNKEAEAKANGLTLLKGDNGELVRSQLMTEQPAVYVGFLENEGILPGAFEPGSDLAADCELVKKNTDFFDATRIADGEFGLSMLAYASDPLRPLPSSPLLTLALMKSPDMVTLGFRRALGGGGDLKAVVAGANALRAHIASDINKTIAAGGKVSPVLLNAASTLGNANKLIAEYTTQQKDELGAIALKIQERQAAGLPYGDLNQQFEDAVGVIRPDLRGKLS
jgi:hypothetical protein